jgi:hypothetical protein
VKSAGVAVSKAVERVAAALPAAVLSAAALLATAGPAHADAAPPIVGLHNPNPVATHSLQAPGLNP